MDNKLNFSPNALLLLKKRYLKKNSQGEVIETPGKMLERVADGVARAEKRYSSDSELVRKIKKSFFEIMFNLEFMPNSPTLMNAGKELGQLSACFVVPVEDSMESIFDAIKSAALIHKTGGGTGFNFSHLRPKSSVVRTTGGVASGPVSFMKVFNAATQAVKQGGTRRGANMGIIRIDHPDILEFIHCKDTEGELSNFNISIAITNDFMERVFRGADYNLIDPHTKEVVKKLNAKEVFCLIAECAYNNGEPGVVFIDKINEANLVPHLGNVESTNPCGEQPLLPYESCNLGSINLAKMLQESAGKFIIDWDKIERVTRLATRFLDDVIDTNKFPIAQIRESTLCTRKIGLGIMGWATMLGFLGIAYDSEEACELAKKVMEAILKYATQESILLAKERGVFPAWRHSVWEERRIRIRNATLTTIAPTGSISIIAGPTSTGIEPVYALGYFRNILGGEKLLEVDPAFEYVAKKRRFFSQDLMEKIISGESIQTMKDIPDDVKKVFVTALDVKPIWHVKMQAAFQEFTDNAVSKTINIPNNARLEDAKEIYTMAYKMGCKGITIYRNGSRKEQVLTTKKEERNTNIFQQKEMYPYSRPRPEVTIGTTTKVATGCEIGRASCRERV